MLKAPLSLVRENILKMKEYSSARSEFSGDAKVFLDANENPHGSPLEKALNRYPDPLQMALKNRLAEKKCIAADRIFLGNGSDEVIDNLIRIFCVPGKDKIMILSPSYGMYTVSAETNNVAVVDVPLSKDFQLDTDKIIDAAEEVKIIFICSPNNPSGNVMKKQEMLRILDSVNCIVVVDEAYADFASDASMLEYLESYRGLVIMQTFSKALGMAGARLGLGLADPELISVMNKVKYPYNINDLTAEAALKALDNGAETELAIQSILEERERLEEFLKGHELVKELFPSDANFILARMKGGSDIYRRLLKKGIVVRDRNSQTHCEDCLRFTVGTQNENLQLKEALDCIAMEMKS